MKYQYQLPPLPYPYEALEPYIDAKTMEIHHIKHHQAYIDKLNAALEKYPDLQEKSLEELLSSLEKLPSEIKIAVQNNGGGHYNHSLFWQWLAPKNDKNNQPNDKLLQLINRDFGNFDNFKKLFSETAASHFGSGWGWLALDSSGKLKIFSMPNQNNPIMVGMKPILGLDVWEHAYYLKYQNRRLEYIENWWNVVNWKEINI